MPALPASLREGDSLEISAYRFGNHLLLNEPPNYSSIFSNSLLLLSSPRPAIGLKHALSSRDSLSLVPLEFQIPYKNTQHLPMFAPLS